MKHILEMAAFGRGSAFEVEAARDDLTAKIPTILKRFLLFLFSTMALLPPTQNEGLKTSLKKQEQTA
ncbi:hypothetical protein T458_26460 [Brevibacillus panacihumi W25]|uniref:Uncharacterized protein n=1 Tax=Brevibacillus panacihumi W25 TaxID=1408254 RepID=V6M2U0_9BACL|nr:hypothetical protein T458_26460 [Brevibacillus panacihumi W25]